MESIKQDTPKIFPVPNSTASYWRSEIHPIDSLRTTEQLPEKCDVLIIGAGLSGVSTAYHLLTNNPSPPSVVMLEAREICSGATGRNGGHLMMVHANINTVTQNYGPEAAREIAKFQAEQVYAMKSVSEKEGIDCDALLTRCCEVNLTQSHADACENVYKAQLKDELDFIHDVNFVGQKHAERVSGIKNAKAAITTTALQLWPYKFVTGLLQRLLERTSINVQAHTPVTNVFSVGDSGTVVETPRGNIRASRVVFATNAYTAGICPMYSQKIVPIKVTCSHISVPSDGKYPPPHLNHTYGLNYNGPADRDYIIPRSDGGLICGGAKRTYIKNRNLWFNNYDDSTLLELAQPHFENVMQKNFRGWENSGASVDYLWTGIIGYTADSWPHCGRVPGQEDQFILAGYNGAGMPLIFLTAKGIARMIQDDIPFEQSGIPRIFKTTFERLEAEIIR